MSRLSPFDEYGGMKAWNARILADQQHAVEITRTRMFVFKGMCLEIPG